MTGVGRSLLALQLAAACGIGACDADEVPTGAAPAPPVGAADRVRFLALGDTGKGSPGQARVAAGGARACAALGCDFVVLLGDNLYPRGADAPDDPRLDGWIGDVYAPIGAPVYLVLGNHDYGHGRDRVAAARQVAWAGRRDGVELPANAWVTDAGPARIVGLDTNAALQFGADFQGDWLRARLAESAAPWKVVFGHHPYRSDGPHGNAGRYEGTRWVPWVSGGSLAGLFQRELCGAADLYLSGHDHSRQLIDPPDCGTDLVVSGAGASATEIVDRGNAPAFARATLGAAWVELRADGTGDVVFLDADGAPEQRFPLRSQAASAR